MKYIEELSYGQCFRYQTKYFILTTDFKHSRDMKCLDLTNGMVTWISASEIVEDIDIYTLDKDNVLIPLRERTNEYNMDKNKNIS